MSIDKLGLLLIDSSLDNIHNIVKNLKNNIYYIFIDNYDINTIIKTSKFDFCGLLFSNYELILDDIKIFDKIDINNYNKYFNFEFNYIQEFININYNDTLILEKPSITFFGGIFTIKSIINSQIDRNTGNITIYADKIGNFNLVISYEFANIIFIKTINVISKPVIIYDNTIYDMNYGENLTILKPQILPFIEGEFYIDTDLINIDKYTGIITNNKNIITNNYIIYFKQNNIISDTQIKINVNSYIKYKNNYYEINYDNYFTSEIPLNYSNINGYYKINNNLFTINVINGEITGKNINVGLYDIIINYAIYNTNIIINVKPHFYYNNTIELIYSNEGYSELPIVKSNITNYYFELYESNSYISIDKLTGKLYFSNMLPVNNYNIIVNLKINNNILTTSNYKLIVKPFINYNLKSMYYDYLHKLDKPNVFPENGLFICNSNIFTIDSNTGIISSLEKPEYGIYKILINYNYNSINNGSIIEIIVKPEIIYNYNKNISYQSIISLGKPNNDYNCIYSLKIDDNNVSINSVTGEFKIINILPVNYYNYEININIFDINFIIYLDFYIVPNINYNINIINYDDIMLSDIPIINPTGGTFKITNNNLLISSNGQINFKNYSIGIYNIDILYTFNNQSTIFNHNITIIPTIKYNNLLVEFVNPLGGDYYLEDNNFLINNKTGQITIINNIVGLYNLNIKYTVNKISTNYNNIVEIKPIVKYSDYNIIIYYNEKYTSEIPIITNINGLFTVNNNDIIIDQLTGQFYISNLSVNTYIFNVIYTLNNTSLLLDFVLVVKPKIIYNNYLIDYLNNFISDKPYTNPEGGRFFCLNNNVKVDNYTGIVEMNNLQIDNYIIPINYYYNNTYNIVNLNLTVYPILIYNYVNNSLLHNINEYGNISLIPIINPVGGIFKINYNNILINQNGIIDFSNFNLIGTYDINIMYIYNNISKEFIYKFSKDPKLLLNSQYEFDYNNEINISLQNEGYYKIDNDNFSVNNLNLVNNNIIDVGKYDINIQYEYNNSIVYKLITIIIKPKIQYTNNYIIINNNNIFISDIPIVQPINGQFICNNNIIINNNGQISIDPLKYYLINDFIVSYKVNDIITNYYFILNVNPYFKYDNTNITIPNNISYYSDIPVLNRNDGVFSISNSYSNLISIDKNGQLYFNKELNFGNYNFDVIYTVNNLFHIENFNVIIKPTISYNLSQITVTYGKYYESNPININTNYISTFNINDVINGITINSNNGILYINNGNNVPIGKYLINVSYNYNDIITNTVITIIIVPELIYNSIINTISYKNNYQSQKPLINPNYGTFKLITNNNITIDNDGIIYGNNLDIGIYNFIIKYICDDIVQESNYSIICNPIINYPNSILEINYGKGGISDIPNCLPLNGTFKLKENIVGVKITNNGLLYFNTDIFIGNYNIEVIYQIYNNIVTTNYNLIVKPVVIYNDSIYIYNKLIITNKPITDFDNGEFKLLNNNNITINKNSGILTLINIEPGNYIFNIEYIKNNISIITNYNVLIKPKIYYPNNNYIFIYGNNNVIIPVVEPPNGIINITNDIINITNNGIINILDLDINKYIFNIDYIYNSIKTSIELNIIINSDLYYEFNEYIYNKNNIIYPKNYRNIGKFESNDININLDGSVNISNFEIGNYLYKVNYIVNEITTIIELKFTIISEFYYNFNNINLVYLINDFYIDNPKVSYKNDTSYFIFEEDNYYLKINKLSGEILVDKTLPIGNYSYNINYFINNIKTTFTINININPFISYKETNILNNDGAIDIKYKNNIYINKPKINPDYGQFKYTLPNGLLFNSDGSIINNNILDVGDYMIEIQYNIDNNKSIEYIRLIVYPEISYINNNIIKLYDTNYESNLPIINTSSEGEFTSSNNIIIDNKTGKLFFNKSMHVDKYNILINYELNNINITTTFNITVIPSIEILINTFNLNYNELFIIDSPIVQPEGGIFTLDNNYNKLTINNNGSININNLAPGEYNIKLIYTYNNLSTDITYKVYIKPIILYNLINNIIIYNSNSESELPILEPEFNINTNLILLNSLGKIDKYGKILFNSFNVGKHSIKIEYHYNNQIGFTIINFEIIPKIYYNQTNYEMDYNKIIYSVIPQLEPKELKFNTELNIDKNGIITFKDYDVGNYSFYVYYESNFVNINLTVKPVFTYNQNNIIKNYGEQLFIYPINNNLGGIFFCYDKEININSENGFINLENIYPCDKIITILYKLNSIISQQDIKIICYPIINYNINQSIIKYDEISYSIIPTVQPIGGNFYSNNFPNNITINNLGILLFNKPNVGKYNFDIIYEYNSIITKTTYTLLVHPIFYYNHDIFNFNKIIKSKQPIINPLGGHIYCNEKNYKITSKYEISSSNISVGDHTIKIYYTINDLTIETLYNFSVIPYILYNDFKTIYNSDDKVIPLNISPFGGIFKIQDYNLYIDNNGSFNIYNLKPDNYNINIIYNYNNKDYNYQVKVSIEPRLEYIDDKLIYLPLEGILKYDNNIFNIDTNNKIILNNSQLGHYNLFVNYTYNNKSTNLSFNFSIITKKFYENTNINILYDENIIINPLINYGKYKSVVSYIIVNENGKIILNNVPIGIYNFIIKYENNNYFENINFIVNVKPKAIYDNLELQYGNYTITPSFMSSKNGIFNFIINYGNIKYFNDGIIKLLKTKPNNYNIDFNYIVNNSIYNGTFNIKIKPNITLNTNKIIKKYSEEYINNSLIVSPVGGNFSSNYSDIIINYNYLEINKEKIVGNYNIELYYEYNNQISIYKIELLIEPQFYYSIDTIKLTYYDIISSVKPFINPNGGVFYMNENIDGITIDQITGIISFKNLENNKIKSILIFYKYMDIITQTNYNINLVHVLYYNQNLNINYSENYDLLSELPTVHPLNGKFSINNNNITINEKTGILRFTNLQVGTYDINVNYIYNDIKLNTLYKFIVKPNIYFEESLITVSYNTYYECEIPFVSPIGGIFNCNNLPNGFYINKINGKIIIYKINDIIKNGMYKFKIKNIADKGNYKLIINYNINDTISSTNLFINII